MCISYMFIVYIILFIIYSNYIIFLTDFLVYKYFDDLMELHINLQILDLINKIKKINQTIIYNLYIYVFIIIYIFKK